MAFQPETHAPSSKTRAHRGCVDLGEVLKNKRELWAQLSPAQDFPGQVILRVDRRVPALVVKSVMHTAAHAGYPQASFAVIQR